MINPILNHINDFNLLSNAQKCAILINIIPYFSFLPFRPALFVKSVPARRCHRVKRVVVMVAIAATIAIIVIAKNMDPITAYCALIVHEIEKLEGVWSLPFFHELGIIAPVARTSPTPTPAAATRPG